MNRVGSWSQLASNNEVCAHFGEQRGADLLLLLSPCTESETPWTGRAETCPTPRQNEVGASPADKSAKPTLRYLCYLLFKPERLGVRFYKHAATELVVSRRHYKDAAPDGELSGAARRA